MLVARRVRLWDIGLDICAATLLDLLTVIEAFVGYRVQLLHLQHLFSRLSHWCQLILVGHGRGDLMRHNQLMLRVDCHLDVVADIHALSDRHRSAVGVGERDLGFATGGQCLLHLLVVLLALAELRDALL